MLLSEHNRRRFQPTLPVQDDALNLKNLRAEFEISLEEIRWVDSLRAQVHTEASAAPQEAGSFVKWFEELKISGPGQNDVLFPWLAEKATKEQLTWFLSQEVAGEAGFEDLVALTQLKIPTRPKLELARNYWDEMGRGIESGMHGPMLDRAAVELKVAELKHPVLTPALDLSNLMSALAHHRQYAYQSLGALGAIELTAPTRTGLVAKGLKRVGASPAAAQYFILHAALDIKHSQAWNAEILFPLVDENPELALPLAEGALMRLHAGAKCFEAYRRHFADEGAIFS